MIPLGDSRRPRRRPWTCWLLAASMIATFVLVARSAASDAVIERWALRPAALAGPGIATAERLAAIPGLAASLFLHGDLLHLAGNLLFLLVLGNDVESKLGHTRFLGFFLAVGVVAGLGHVAARPLSATPTIGASGAISGVLAAFLVLFPRAKLRGALPIGCLVLPVRTRAFLFVPGWFALQLWLALATPDGPAGVAWFAHLAGFAAGPPLYWLLARR